MQNLPHGFQWFGLPQSTYPFVACAIVVVLLVTIAWGASNVAIDGYGLEIVERVPLEVHPTERSRKYLEAKKNKMGHLLKLV